jgi:hypothetical protein
MKIGDERERERERARALGRKRKEREEERVTEKRETRAREREPEREREREREREKVTPPSSGLCRSSLTPRPRPTKPFKPPHKAPPCVKRSIRSIAC